MEIVEFTPHEGQKKVMLSQKRFIAAVGGKRSGKTTIGGHWSFREMSVPNTAHLICAPIYAQLEQSTLVSFFSSYPQLEQYYRKQKQMMRLPNGSNVYFRSLDDPKHVEGLNLNSIWVDEADALPRHIWNTIRGRVATTGGRIILTSSIYASSWIYEDIYQKRDSDFEVVMFTSRDNPAFPQSEWEKLKKELDPITFNREYGAEFVFGAGLVYPGITRFGILNTNKLPPLVEPRKTFIGLDFGYSDPTAMVVMQFATDGRWYIVDEIYKRGMNIDDINYWLDHFYKKYGKFYTIVDPQSAIAKHSLHSRFNVLNANNDISSGITLVRNIIHQSRLLIFSSCISTLKEFGSYVYSSRGVGEVPQEGNDHAMDAIRYVINTCYDWVSNREIDKEPEELPLFWQRKELQGVIKNGQFNTDYVDSAAKGDYDELELSYEDIW